MNILFICKFNRFRSKVAEALARHYIRRKDVEIRSAGILVDFIRPFMAKEVVEIIRNKGIENIDERSMLLNEQAIQWADKIIVVASDCPLGKLPPERIEIWPVEDASEQDMPSVLMRISEIEKHVNALAERLNRKK